MIDLKKLSDEELALLTYGVEEVADAWRMMKVPFRDVSERVVRQLRDEYSSRVLAWEDYYNEEMQ